MRPSRSMLVNVIAVVRGDLELRGKRGVGRLGAHGAGGRAPRQPLGERAERVQRFHAFVAVEDVCRRRLEVGCHEADAQRFGAGHGAQEAHDREELGRFRGGERRAPHLACADESAALAPVVVDLQVVHPLAAHFDELALPQQRLLLRGLARRRAQRRLVLQDDRIARPPRQSPAPPRRRTTRVARPDAATMLRAVVISLSCRRRRAASRR